MVCDYSTILSTSVLSESVFSIAGLQVTKRQNRLAPKTIGVIMCMRSWGLISKSINDESSESDNKDICKDKAFGRAETDEVIMDSQHQEHQE